MAADVSAILPLCSASLSRASRSPFDFLLSSPSLSPTSCHFRSPVQTTPISIFVPHKKKRKSKRHGPKHSIYSKSNNNFSRARAPKPATSAQPPPRSSPLYSSIRSLHSPTHSRAHPSYPSHLPSPPLTYPCSLTL